MHRAEWRKKSAKSAVIFSSFFSIALGLSIIFGWHFAWMDFLKFGEGHVPVHFYSGILFIVSGVALSLTQLYRDIYLGLIVSAIGVLYATFMGSQYILFSDALLEGPVVDATTGEQFAPNNAAPNTLLCFFLGNFSLFIWHLSKNKEGRRSAVVLPSVVILTISLIALFGYLTGIDEAYSWWAYSGMAFHSAHGLAVFSIGLLMLAWKEGHKIRFYWPKKSIFAVIAGIVLTIMIVQSILHYEKQREEKWLSFQPFEIAQTIENLILIVFVTGVGLSILIAGLLQQNEKVKKILSVLRSSEEDRELATAAANIGLWDWDMKNEKIKWSGNAWKLLGGRNNNELPETNISLRARMPEEDRVSIDEKVAKSASENDMFSIEFRYRRMNDNKEIWLLSNGRRTVSEHGEMIRSSGIIMDITERKIAEKHLLRSNRELEQFAYIASHDLKAPLRSIDNLAKWVIEDHSDSMPQDAGEKLGLLRGRVARLETLLSDILSYSRAGSITEQATRIDIQTLFRSLKENYIPESFTFKTSSELQILFAPKTPLEQVLGNLLVNAVKHHDQKSGEISLTVEDEAAFYRFSVSDNGPGIPAEFHERVFQMFQTLQSRDKVDGSGLGMSIVKKLVEWQGGKVWIKSKEGRGTDICILWPKINISQHSVDVFN